MKLIQLPVLKLDDKRPLKNVFKDHAENGKLMRLEPREKMCHDCGMKGLYNEIADELLKEDVQTQDDNLKSWFCHDKPDCACRGVYNYIHKKRRIKERLP